ncbi:hypothetical protein GCM10010495_51270 [Kitasatospora herbaricolor]|nr:hypothetical protein GCM10010495_51270 [Kitasatospora herbaricolor]
MAEVPTGSLLSGRAGGGTPDMPGTLITTLRPGNRQAASSRAAGTTDRRVPPDPARGDGRAGPGGGTAHSPPDTPVRSRAGA